LTKTTLYRRGADETPATDANASTTTYCQNLINVGIPRIMGEQNIFLQKPSPDGGATANSLFTFLANRLNATLGAGGLNCVGLLNINNPVTLTVDGNGIVTAATLTTTTVTATTTTTVTPTTTTTTTTSAVTGSVSVILDTNAGNAQVALNLTFANFANQQFFVTIADSATGKQILHQSENTDGNGANAAATVINNLQGLTAFPASWVATITDANGNTLGTANVVTNGANATFTFSSTSATTAATPTMTTTTSVTPTVAATTTAGENGHDGYGGQGGGHHHHHG
jgi:hypothetical protein